MNNATRTVLDKGFVRLVDEPDSDLKVVNAARVSFRKSSQLEDGKLSEKDVRLIRYLATHGHWTPFAHCTALVVHDIPDDGFCLNLLETASMDGVQSVIHNDKMYSRISLAHVTRDRSWMTFFNHSCRASLESFGLEGFPLNQWDSNWSRCLELAPVTLHMKMPVFIARQFMRSNVGVVYNEVSRRYVDDAPEFYLPREWRGRPVNAKQGSQGVVELHVDTVQAATKGQEMGSVDPAQAVYAVAQRVYEEMLAQGVAPEMARMVLPVAHYTEFWATMGLRDAKRIWKLRVDPHAQWEVQEFARAMDQVIEASPMADMWKQIKESA